MHCPCHIVCSWLITVRFSARAAPFAARCSCLQVSFSLSFCRLSPRHSGGAKHSGAVRPVCDRLRATCRQVMRDTGRPILALLSLVPSLPHLGRCCPFVSQCSGRGALPLHAVGRAVIGAAAGHAAEARRCALFVSLRRALGRWAGTAPHPPLRSLCFLQRGCLGKRV